MDKLNIVCAFTDFGNSWYGNKTDDFLESVRSILIRSFGKNVRVDWDNVFSTNVPYLYGNTFEIKVNPMNHLGHFCVSSPNDDYKDVILTNIINYDATKNAALVRIPTEDRSIRFLGEYDDEGLFATFEYLNQPVCLALEVLNMALRILGDFNDEAKEMLLDAIKKVLIEDFGFKATRVESAYRKVIDRKVSSGIFIEEAFSELIQR